MNVALDIGNTKVKLALFDDELIFVKYFLLNDIKNELKLIFNLYPKIKNLIVCSVIDFKFNYEQFDFKNIHILSVNSKLPFVNYYCEDTLGNDRIALVSSASIKYPHENVLIIDVGTCITYDFINNENQYTGGAISPGLNMRLRSLNKFTGKLPLIKLKEIDNFNGLNTKDSINIGVLKGVIFEIQGFINKYSSDNQNLTVILTGGNSKFLSKQLKISIFANQNFLVEGLNELIKLNIKN